MDTPLKFLLFYTTFIFFVTTISAQAGLTIFGETEAMQDLIAGSAENTLNPLWYIGVVGAMMSLSSEFTLIYILFIAPFVVGLGYIILEKVIDIIPF